MEIGKETGVKLSFVCVGTGRHRDKKNRMLSLGSENAHGIVNGMGVTVQFYVLL